MEMFNDKEWRVRQAAAEAVCRTGSPEVKKALLVLTGFFKDTDPQVRRSAVESLGSNGSAAEPAVPAITGLLKDEDSLSARWQPTP